MRGGRDRDLGLATGQSAALREAVLHVEEVFGDLVDLGIRVGTGLGGRGQEPLAFRTLAEIRDLLGKGEITAVELAEAQLERGAGVARRI